MAILSIISFASFAKEAITISTDNSTIVLLAEKGEPVYYLYWGETLTVSPEVWAGRYYNSKPDSNESRAAQMFPSFGGSCYLTPAIRITHSDGGLVTDLVYDSYRTEKEGDDIENTVIVLKDVVDPIFVEVCFTSYRHTDVIAQSAKVINKGKKKITVDEIASSFLPLHATDYYLSHFSGTWAANGECRPEIYRAVIYDLEFVCFDIESLDGQTAFHLTDLRES